MSQVVDFTQVSTEGFESSPVADALAGLRANEARYFKNTYDHIFTVDGAADVPEAIDRVWRILEDERDIVIAARHLQASVVEVAGIHWTPCLLRVRARDQRAVDPRRRRQACCRLQAVRRHGGPRGVVRLQVRQKSKLADMTLGSYFVIRGDYPV